MRGHCNELLTLHALADPPGQTSWCYVSCAEPWLVMIDKPPPGEAGLGWSRGAGGACHIHERKQESSLSLWVVLALTSVMDQ